MQTFKKEFKNELGNAIEVKIDSREIDGLEGVLISISGPTSLSENHVTQQEAQVIHEQLGLFLEEMENKKVTKS